jgi:hypothetical protein
MGKVLLTAFAASLLPAREQLLLAGQPSSTSYSIAYRNEAAKL